MANTKQRILDTAITLFNQQGSAAVTTNHIAEALGISPGNLYYHFRNKDEIIRAAFERQFEAGHATFVLPADRPLTVDDVVALVRANFALMREYRFIYRELAALLRQDDILRDRYLAVRGENYDGFRELFNMLVASGVVARVDDATLTRLADLCWLISEFWLPSVEISGSEADDAQTQQGIDLMLQVLRPYLTG